MCYLDKLLSLLGIFCSTCLLRAAETEMREKASVPAFALQNAETEAFTGGERIITGACESFISWGFFFGKIPGAGN